MIRSGNRESAKKIAMSREYLWPNIIKESKQLLGALGIPCISSPASAESQCAQLVKDRLAHYSNSQDFDSLLFGCPHQIQNFSKSLRRKVQGRWKYQKVVPVVIDLKDNLKRLGIDQFQLVDIGILIGNDYFPGIRKIGPNHAYKFVKNHKNLENVILKEKKNYDFSSLTQELIAKVRKIFLLPEVIIQYPSLNWNFPNEQRTLSLLCEEHYLNRERVQKNLAKLFANFDKCRDYFEKQKISPQTVQKTLDQLS